MKRFTLIAIVLCLVLALSMGLAACRSTQLIDAKGTVTVVVVDNQGNSNIYTADLAKVKGANGLMAILDYLKDHSNLSYEATDGFINSVDGLHNDYAAGDYVYIYTSVQEDWDVSQWASSVQYNGMTLISSGVGASEMHIKDGCTIYLGVLHMEW